MTCLTKHPYECCGCSEHPTEPPPSTAWLDHIDTAHGCSHDRTFLWWDGHRYCSSCDTRLTESVSTMS